MCCHCQVRQHALHCDSQPIIFDNFAIALCVPFLYPYLVSGIREDWRDFTLRAGDVLSPCPTPKGKEGTNTTWVVLEWKVQAYHFTKYHHQHSDKPINKGYKQRRAKFCKVSASHYQSGYFQIKNAQPSGYAWIYQNDIIKMRNRIGYAKANINFSIIARSSIITTAGAFVKQLIYQIVTRTRSYRDNWVRAV